MKKVVENAIAVDTANVNSKLVQFSLVQFKFSLSFILVITVKIRGTAGTVKARKQYILWFPEQGVNIYIPLGERVFCVHQ